MGRNGKIKDRDWRKIDKWLALGLKKKDIAKRLNIHPTTLSRNIKAKKDFLKTK